MITLLLILFFATSSEPIFTIDKLSKEIRKNVSGEEQKTRLLYLIKESKKKIKRFRKEEKKANKKFRNLVISEQNSTLEIEKYYELSRKRKKNQQSFLVTTRLEMQQLITDIEWNNIVDATANPSKKKLRKIKKTIKKSNNLTKKKFGRVKEVIQSAIENSDKKIVMIELMITLENDVFKYMDILREHTFHNNEIVRDHNASKIELEQLLSKEAALREEVITSFVKFYNAGSKNLSDTEWNPIKKSLKHLLN